jgi:DNA-directed RNA polymerase specialized sigma24 family protein
VKQADLAERFDQQAICDGVRAGNSESENDLYVLLCRWRYLVYGHVGNDSAVEDLIHDAYLVIRQEILNRAIRDESHAIFSYAKTILIRKSYLAFHSLVAQRKRYVSIEDPVDRTWIEALRDKRSANVEQSLIDDEMQTEMRTVLHGAVKLLRPHHRELIVRCDINGEPWRQIRDDLGLTDAKFRITKSRARGVLARIIHHHMAHGEFPESAYGAAGRPPKQRLAVFAQAA